MAALLRGAGRDLTGLLARPGALLTVGNARAVLEREGRQYDQIILPVPYGRAGGWGAPRWCENYLYTREALQTYWDHLRPGGSLAFLTADEPLFMRALLAVWQATEGEGAGAGSFGRHSWGFEIASLDPLLTPYRYLLLAVKGEVTEAQQQHAVQLVDRVRARGLSKGTALSALFGPGVVAKRQYQALFRVGGLTAARTALSRAVSWRMKSFADLSAATDVRPFLFRMERDLHPLLKWLLGGVLLAQTAIFLLPLGNERRLAHPDSGRRPPLPVLLGYFSTATLAITLTVILLACHTAPLAGRLDGSLVLTIAALLLGGIGAVVDLRRREAGRLPWVAVVGAALASVVLVGGVLRLAPEPAIKWAAPMRMLLPVAAALPAGFLYALLVRLGADHLARTLPALLPWLWTTVGLSVAGGTIGALWLAQYGGWLAVGATVVGCWVTTLVIGIITTVLARCRTARITTAA
jgi:hypothetical protein